MLKPQVRIALRNCGIIDPEKINHYIARGGYSGIVKALSISPEEVIEEFKLGNSSGSSTSTEEDAAETENDEDMSPSLDLPTAPAPA